MINGINAARPAPNAIPNVDDGNNDGQKNQEAVSDVQTEETPNIVLTEETDHSKEVSNVQEEDTIHIESTQGDNEANEKPLTAQNELRGTNLDVWA